MEITMSMVAPLQTAISIQKVRQTTAKNIWLPKIRKYSTVRTSMS